MAQEIESLEEQLDQVQQQLSEKKNNLVQLLNGANQPDEVDEFFTPKKKRGARRKTRPNITADMVREVLKEGELTIDEIKDELRARYPNRKQNALHKFLQSNASKKWDRYHLIEE